MNEQVQGLLPISMEEASFRGRAPMRPRVTSVAVHDPRGDLFLGDDDAARRPGSITGQVRKITYSNLETGFHILRVALDEGGQLVTFAGPCEPVSEGDRVEAVGTWEHHARYGTQLKSRFIRTLVPTTGAEIHAFLIGGGIKGVGKKSADKLLDHFGDRLRDVLLSPTTMMASGITQRQADAIAEAWRQRSSHTEIVSFLQSLSIGPATIDKIIKKYGEKAKQSVQANPYRLAREIAGIGFKTADQVALAMGFDRRDVRRVDAAVIHVMNQIGRDGHCACPRSRIIADVRSLLTIEDHDIKAAIERLVEKRQLIEEENGGSKVIYEVGVLRCEEEIARKIAARIAPMGLPDGVDELIAQAASDIGITEIHEHQAMAVKTSLGAHFSVITGGPGAGKTSSLEVLLRVFENLNPGCRIALCAPTGRAAQRMSESTGRDASTIHRLLEWAPDRGGFQRKEENPIDADLVVIDEASMLDIWLTRDVLRAVREDAVIVLVGDVDQLPSVGAGRVLGDVIDSGIVPVTRLTRIFRQGAGSQIAMAAKDINSGRMPRIGAPNRRTDMWASYDDDPAESMRKICRLVADIAPSMGFDPLRDVQVLTAGHNGALGTISLNAELQKILNPPSPNNPGADLGDRIFRVGDRVIQTTNNYDLDVFNGDIGQVVSVKANGARKDSYQIMVAFQDREVSYSGAEARQLTLAYAISVHKSQGSEFPFVIFVPTTQHFTMLRKTLIYTAITRARKICALVGQDRAARIAVGKSDKGRVTGLAKRLAIEEAEIERMTA